jgi:hypothetical protein
MVSSSSGKSIRANPDKDKTLRYRTRVFAAECLSLLPEAVGNDAAHFDILLARNLASNRQSSGDWLVLQLQELISLAYQISTIQFENMRPIGVGLLSTILEKVRLFGSGRFLNCTSYMCVSRQYFASLLVIFTLVMWCGSLQ